MSRGEPIAHDEPCTPTSAADPGPADRRAAENLRRNRAFCASLAALVSVSLTIGLTSSSLNSEIADELHYAESTVKADIRHINQLGGVENRLQIVLRATELGIISL